MLFHWAEALGLRKGVRLALSGLVLTECSEHSNPWNPLNLHNMHRAKQCALERLHGFL